MGKGLKSCPPATGYAVPKIKVKKPMPVKPVSIGKKKKGK